MKSIFLGVTCLIWCLVFNQSHVQASCKPGTYPSKHMVGGDPCVGCPEKCDDQSSEDIDACKNVCEKEHSTPAPVTPSTHPIRTSRVNISPSSRADEGRNRKNKTRNETVEDKASGLTDADRLAIIIGVLAVFILFLIAAVFLMWKNSKSLSVDVKVDEEEAREMCSNSESSDYNQTAMNDKRRDSDDESECASEGPSQEIVDTRSQRSNEYPSSELCLHKPETYF